MNLWSKVSKVASSVSEGVKDIADDVVDDHRKSRIADAVDIIMPVYIKTGVCPCCGKKE